MKTNVVLLYKSLGETPLDTITRYKAENNLESEKLSFAGRLDPMAEGLLLVLKNDENKQRHMYEDLTKTYECSFVSGFATDTYDILGKVTQITNTLPDLDELQNNIKIYISSLPGKKVQAYPPFSSFHLKGKPLYYWERRGELDHDTLPTKEILIESSAVIRDETLSKKQLEEHIYKRLLLVKGDFRQESIRQEWLKAFEKIRIQHFLQTHLRITCSSGTYVRGIINTLGKDLRIPTVATSIIRTKIGSYSLKDVVNLT